MATATKQSRAKSRESRAKPNGHAGKSEVVPRRRIQERAVWATNLDPAVIAPSPFQPRQSFPEEEIRALADSIAAQGQLQPILVRPAPQGTEGRFELIDGDRRTRAVRLLGLSAIRAEVGDFSDAEVRAMIWDSADKREDYGPLEKARLMQAAIAAGDAEGPTDLARKWNVSQGHVSSYLAMLEYPKAIQQRIISREMPATHARLIAPFAKHPRLAKAVEDDIEQQLRWDKELPSIGAFVESIEECVVRATRDLDGETYSRALGRRIKLPAWTEEQLAQLDVIEIGDGRTKERRAANVKLWEKLLAAEEQRQKERQEKQGEKKKGLAITPTGKVTGDDGSPKKISAEEVKRQAAEEKRRREEADKRTANRVYDLWIDWQRRLIRDQLLVATPGQLAAILINLLCSESTLHNHQSRRQRLCEDLLAAEKIRVPQRKDGYWSRPRLLAALAELRAKDDAAPERALCDLAMRMHWVKPGEGSKEAAGPSPVVPPGDVCDTVELLGIDLAAEWKRARMGDLTEPYFDAHTKDQLAALGEELGVYLDAGKPKSVAVNVLLGQQKPLPFPKELAKPKRPK